jgi:hypothetical protein
VQVWKGDHTKTARGSDCRQPLTVEDPLPIGGAFAGKKVDSGISELPN